MKIISAFPACGKSYLFKNSGYKIADSDSSLFSWESPGVRHKDFPNNYMAHINSILEKNDYVFVSSHKVVRDALVAQGFTFTLVYPDISLKDEWLERCRNRGNDEGFINMLDTNWEKFILEIEAETGYNKVKLQSQQYLSDVYETICGTPA